MSMMTVTVYVFLPSGARALNNGARYWPTQIIRMECADLKVKNEALQQQVADLQSRQEDATPPSYIPPSMGASLTAENGQDAEVAREEVIRLQNEKIKLRHSEEQLRLQVEPMMQQDADALAAETLSAAAALAEETLSAAAALAEETLSAAAALAGAKLAEANAVLARIKNEFDAMSNAWFAPA
jgi:FtsZ-binding cell division protein ZapB